MSKIVVLTGSPRKNGNTLAMVRSFCEASVAEGNVVEVVDTTAIPEQGCRACNGCYSTGGKCVYDAGWDDISEHILAADAIVIAAPVYWYTFPAQIKAVIDKFYSFCVVGRGFGGKKAALISCCEESGMDTFVGISFSFKKSMELMQWEVVDELLVPGVNVEGDIKKTNGEAKAAELAKKMAAALKA